MVILNKIIEHFKMIIELGAFGSSAIECFDDLGHRMQTVCQDTRARMFLMQRLSVAMQRGNAACILGTIADDDFSIEFFV